jgi:flagellar motor switch protein FliN/FliY
MSFTRQEWVDRFVADLATVIGALVAATPTAGPSTEPPSDGWVVTLRADQGSRGELVVEFDRAATEVLTKRIIGMEVEPPDEVVVDTLKEICAQAAGTMVLEPPLVGTKLAVASVERAAAVGAAQAPVLAQIAADGVVTLPLRLWGDIALAESALPVQASPSPQPVNPKLDVILDIDLPLTVRFGRTEMPLYILTALGPGSVIDLGRSPDDPVDVLVSNQLVARGEVVMVGGNYGVRITDVMSPADRVRSMEGEF